MGFLDRGAGVATGVATGGLITGGGPEFALGDPGAGIGVGAEDTDGAVGFLLLFGSNCPSLSI